MDFGSRLRRKLTELGLSESEAGRRSGVPQPTINRILSGESSSPRRPTVEKLAKALKVSPDWLMFGGREDRVDVNVEPTLGPTRYFEYPEISWVQAGAAMEAMELLNVAACEAHPSDAWAGPNGFWLKVRGPSMTSQGGISFVEGMVILVAPGFDVENGNYCVAKMTDTNEATFKQFVWDSGRAYLKPLNPAFPTVEVDGEWVIVGKVVDAKWPRSVLA
ncbi:phage repressor protein [Pseudomonas graminis]|uniref:LexA family protein n=1 Tax=Pseudomonas graminis TaxID=158627 RepID=UPI00105C8430|nr:S24 family peptidase [Pseudomonas graminis]TDV43755.1 phage repressor protein [Pseudomonas graminis]